MHGLDQRAAARESAGQRVRRQAGVDVVGRPGEGQHSRELLQEAQVALEEQAQVGHAEADHGDAIQSAAEGEAGVALRVDAAGLEHVGVDHPGPRQLEPARPPGLVDVRDLHVHRRLGEREEVRLQQDLAVRSEQLAEEVQHRPLEVGHGKALVDGEALHLVEHGAVGGVHVVAAVTTARARSGSIGGPERCISRTCTGEVWVRSIRSGRPSMKKVSLGERAGCPGGVLRAVKLCHSVSTSGPSAIR